MLGHLRRRPTQRSSATPICPPGGDGTGRADSFVAPSPLWQSMRSSSLRALDPSHSPQTYRYLQNAVLAPKQVYGSGLNHVQTPEIPDLTGILEFDKESSERPERRHFR